MKIIVHHLDISPNKNKKCCQNCKSFDKFGVHTGFCILKEKEKLDINKCKNFKKYRKHFESKVHTLFLCIEPFWIEVGMEQRALFQ